MDLMTIELPEPTRQALAAMAEHIGISPAQAVADAINEWLAHARAVYDAPPNLSDWTC